MRDELTCVVKLREEGEPEEARTALLRLVGEHPHDPRVNYRCAWVHNAPGLEREILPFYESTIANGLAGGELEDALIGLGSTHRVLGEYGGAVEVLRDGVARFPGNRVMQVFFAMAPQNAGEHSRAMELLLRNLAETTADGGISLYKRAISFYAGRLDETQGQR